MSMRSNAFSSFASALLAGAACAAPVHEVFQANRDAILASRSFVAGDYVFTTGRVRSSSALGRRQIGFAKAELIAKGNLDDFVFQHAPWPQDVSSEEKDASWLVYRQSRPFRVAIAGGRCVCHCADSPGCFLAVMAYPRSELAKCPMPQTADLASAVDEWRRCVASMEQKVDQVAQGGAALQSVPPSVKVASPILPPQARENQPTNGVPKAVGVGASCPTNALKNTREASARLEK